MKKLITIIFIFINILSFAQEIVPNTAFVKLKPEYSHYFQQNNRIQNTSFSTIGLNKVTSFAPKKDINKRQKPTKIDRIYKLEFDYNVSQALELLKQEDIFEVVEPSPVFEVLYTPNDTLTSNNKLNQINIHDFYTAWDIEKGDTNVTIGIIDTGHNFEHKDLQSNLKYNPFDQIDGINNDGDMYFDSTLIDNYRGWDMADWDNDPTGKHEHGTNVAGVAVATGDNIRGITGVAFNCRYIPIKVAPDNSPTSITHGYDGLKYAAEHDCKVINLSWGSVIPFYQILHDLVEYSVFDMNAVVIAAAGNSGKEEYYYPASFDNVLSVTSLANDSTVLPSSTYNYNVDLIAAGSNLQTTSSTSDTNSYRHDSGTSLAAPVVSGTAALLRSKHPELYAVQVMHRLRVTGNIIDTNTQKIDVKYKDKIGRMLNPIAALTNDTTPAFKTLTLQTDKSNNNISNTGDTVLINLSIINYLAKSKNGKVTVEKVSGDFEWVDSTFLVQDLETFDTTRHEETPLKIYVPASSKSSLTFVMRIKYTADGYTDHQYINFQMTPTVISVTESISTKKVTIENIVYPNPFSNTIHISLDKQLLDQSVSFVIHNAQQQKIIEIERFVTNTHQNFDLSSSDIPRGMYILTIKNGTFTEHHKLIKN